MTKRMHVEDDIMARKFQDKNVKEIIQNIEKLSPHDLREVKIWVDEIYRDKNIRRRIK